MVLKFCFVILVGAPFLVQGQIKTGATNKPSEIQLLQREVNDLRAQLIDIQKNIASLETATELEDYEIKGKQDRQDSLGLNLTDRSFQRIDTDTGFFLVSVEEVTPYLNGYKLHLSVGNPMSAKYSGVKIKIKWGKSYDFSKYSEPSFNVWQKSVQEKEFPITEMLQAGTWNKVELILAPATIDQLGFVRLSISTDTVALSRQQS
jgi:hypothetical protein